jgi:hypothetical protein
VPDIAKCVGRTFRGEQGHCLTVDGESGQNRLVRLIGPPSWTFDPNTHFVELTDARGHTVRMPQPLNLAFRPPTQPQPEDLAWLATAPMPSLAGLPWPALALQGPRRARLEWYGWLYLWMPPSFKGPVTLRIFRFERQKVEVPFELSDVPLP